MRGHPAQGSEATMIVGIRPFAGVFVRVARPIEQRWGIDQISGRLSVEPSSHHTNLLLPRHGQGGHIALMHETGPHTGKARQEHTRIDPLVLQSGRQSACHIGKPAGFEQGKKFRTDLQQA
jgi:hypothetical protein